MRDWLIIDFDCRANLASRFGAQRARAGGGPYSDTIRIFDEFGREWHWEILPELLIAGDEGSSEAARPRHRRRRGRAPLGGPSTGGA